MRFSSDTQIALLALVISSCLSLWSVAELISKEKSVLEIYLPFAFGSQEYLLIHELGCLGALKSEFNASANPELKFDAQISVVENEQPEILLISAEVLFNSDRQLEKALINLRFQGKNNALQIQLQEHEQALKLQMSIPRKPTLQLTLGNRPYIDFRDRPLLTYEYSSFLEQATLSFSQNLVSEKLAVQLKENRKNSAGCPAKSQHMLNIEDIFPGLKKIRKGLLRENQILLES